MGGPRSLRLATLLGPNTSDDLGSIGSYLGERGYRTTTIEIEPTGAATAETVAEHGIDVLWACGLLTGELVAGGVDLDVVAAPVFAGETASVYRSVIVTRRDGEPPARRLAVNEFASWSGYRVLFHDASVRGNDRWHPDQMDGIVVTGAHVASAAAVADGRADVAAIDHSVWNWLTATDPRAVEPLIVVDRTIDCPAPPISLGPTVRGGYRAALMDALLGFEGPPLLVPASIDDYRFMLA